MTIKIKKIFFGKISVEKCCLIFIITLLLFSFQEGRSQNISDKIFGQNAWMPYSIGSTVYNGKLDSQWKKIKDSQAKIIRYGGIAVDIDMPTNDQYLKMIDSIRSNEMEPVMLVSFYNNKYTAAQAGETVDFINNKNNKNIKYWIIGNEPDNSYGYVNSAQVADYVKAFSSAMKKKDPSIKIIAPETAWYNQNIINGLITPGGVSDITGKDSLGNFIVDVISFHTFPFRGTQKRKDVISYLSGPGNFEDNLIQLNQKIAACNTYHQRDLDLALKMAVTEANIDWKNPRNDDIFGVGANSFLAGQFWAEMIGICMKKNVDFINFWSVIEGNELGFLNQTTELPKPSYYHFQMMADNFKGIYCNGKSGKTNIKSFGSNDNGQVSVMILNEDQSNDFIYTLRLDTNLISGTNPLKININAGAAIEYSDTVYRESSVMLNFNSTYSSIKKCVYKLRGNADKNIPPTCKNISVTNPLTGTIVSPTNNASFTEGSTITIQATASGGTGIIQKVEFFAGTTNLGVSTAYPYSYIWPGVAAGNYVLTVKVTDNGNNTVISPIININVNPVGATCTATGTITREVWNNISGTSVSSIPLSTTPNSTGQLSIFEAPQNIADNYGQRISGYVCPPVTGNYIFWIASDDNSELWLSTNNDQANKQKIAFVSSKTLSRQWTKYASQQSASIYLVSGQQYYIEALHKEGYLKDNVAVGWQLPNAILERPIPGNRLSPFIINQTKSIELVSTGNGGKSIEKKYKISNTLDTLRQNTILENNIDLIIYPNPTTGQFIMEFCINDIKEKNVFIEVTNSIGKVVYKMQPQKINGCIKETIQLESGLPTGVYLMRVSIDDLIQTSKILLTR